ncbi:hypothetical protein BXZ70DRAFT_902739 [Cristinia sonorae]|uniref:Uncharacterized protein n=1 Tax=Cristinia sonorae TaxID=1940300 RepID=A0A8K0XJJ3_9AGAR|nr:hypothetical protein BXZ70DRAFT_902739 [Cristinia sonorae]
MDQSQAKKKKPGSEGIPANTVEKFKWPDPNEPPTEVEHNPHSHLSQRQDTPTSLPRDPKTPYFDTIYPRIVITYNDLTASMAEAQKEGIRNDKTTLAVVPLGAGSAWFKRNPEAHVQLTKFFRDLNVEENADAASQIVVYPPEARIDRSGQTFANVKQMYAKPWPLILTGAGENLRKFATWFQTFAVSEDMVFSVVEFDETLQSWVIANIGADPNFGFLTPGCEKRILKEIKDKLWSDDKFRRFVDFALGAQGVAGSACDRVVIATQSLTVEFLGTMQDEDVAKKEVAVVQLRGKPISPIPETHTEWLAHIRRIIKSCRYNPHVRFDVVRVFKACTACKSEAHPTNTCPFLHIQHWYGPSLEKYKAMEKRTLDSAKGNHEKSPARGDRGGRGRRGGRGANRGRGWQTVGRGGHVYNKD